MKIALCFLISGKNQINKENIWKSWIEEIKDHINVYIHYTNYSQIQSPWIKKHCLPREYIALTNYYHVVPAYMLLMQYASMIDEQNQWFCFLTESCCPIISANKFKKLFLRYSGKSIIKYRPIWWNPIITRRANLHSLKKEYQLANNPWFILSRDAVNHCLYYRQNQYLQYTHICRGNIANESIFAIMLYHNKMLSNEYIINEDVTAADWDHMETVNSPYTFYKGDKEENLFIEKQRKNPYTIFLRKVSTDFPDELLYKYANIRPLSKDSNSTILKNISLLCFIFFFFYFIFIFQSTP
jgi:hypothetical protein